MKLNQLGKNMSSFPSIKPKRNEERNREVIFSSFCFRIDWGMSTLIKKKIQIFLIYKEIQMGSVAKSYMTNGLLIYVRIFAHFLIY